MVETGRQDIDTAQRIDRASSNDLVTLATDRGQVPLNLGAVLIIERGSELDAAGVRVAVEQRLPNVPRMRRRLLRAPLGCGRAGVGGRRRFPPGQTSVRPRAASTRSLCGRSFRSR